MSRIQSNKTRIGLLAVALVGGINFASTAFSAEALPQGYQLAAAEKTSEGKCGEGKCGDASFARTDTDDDGRVSLKELLAVAPKGTEEFKAMDTNSDGFLSEGEVYKFRTNQFTSNGKKVPTELFTKLSQAKD
ncbi:hypothetical protein [Pseudomonas fluorescens]|uniref:EF-hand domain-containing protein n=1 Tax=Pseudomonas fluorescens TaxID=294 RepID=A0A5E6QH16_PSEFL|nr:hypothetical protein [Pseudomonas fluorescens]VVM54568.1 hypothetical protein PS659_00992 [Pseudomonas fluorescens]